MSVEVTECVEGAADDISPKSSDSNTRSCFLLQDINSPERTSPSTNLTAIGNCERLSKSSTTSGANGGNLEASEASEFKF